MLSTEVLFDILCFLARHDMDALQLVNAAIDGLLTAHFDDHPLRRLELTVNDQGVYVLEKPAGFNQSQEVVFSGEGLVDGSAARCLQQLLLRAFVSNLAVVGSLTHNMVDMLLPVKAQFCNAVCSIPLTYANLPAVARALNELLDGRKIEVGNRFEYIWSGTIRVEFFRFRCWEVCNELHFVRRADYPIDGLIEWLSAGTGREFTAVAEDEVRIMELIEKLHQQFSAARTPSSYRLNLNYMLLNQEPRVKSSVRSNDDTHEQLEVELKTNGRRFEITVRRYRLE